MKAVIGYIQLMDYALRLKLWGGGLEPKIMEENNKTICLNSKVDGKQPSLTDRVYDSNGCSTAITTSPFFMGSVLEEPIKIKEATKKGYTEAEVGDSVNLSFSESKTRRGRVGKGVAQTLDCNCKQGVVEPIAYDEQNKCLRKDGTVGTLTTDGSSPKHNNRVIEPTYELSPQMKRYIVAGDNKYKVNENNLQLNRDIACAKTTREGSTRADASDYISPDREDNCQLKMGEDLMPYRIRKLTPKECFRLMGVKDEDYYKVLYGDVPIEYIYKMENRTLKKEQWKILWRYMRHPHQSNSSLYHLAGDSIVCNGMLTALLGQLFEFQDNERVGE